MKDMFIGLGSNFWGNAIFNLQNNINSLYGEFLPFHIKLIPVYFSLLGAFFIYYLNYLLKKQNKYKISLSLKNVYNFLIHKWYFDVIYNRFLVQSALNLGFFTFKDVDRGVVEILGPLGLVRFFNFIKNKVISLQSSYVYNYVFLIIIGLTFFLTYIFLVNIFYINFFDLRWFLICILIIIFF